VNGAEEQSADQNRGEGAPEALEQRVDVTAEDELFDKGSGEDGDAEEESGGGFGGEEFVEHQRLGRRDKEIGGLDYGGEEESEDEAQSEAAGREGVEGQARPERNVADAAQDEIETGEEKDVVGKLNGDEEESVARKVVGELAFEVGPGDAGLLGVGEGDIGDDGEDLNSEVENNGEEEEEEEIEEAAEGAVGGKGSFLLVGQLVHRELTLAAEE
jgi:hypothetical protein